VAVSIRRAALAIAAALCLAALGLALLLHRDDANDTYAGYNGTPLRPPKVAADFTLTDGNGRAARVLDGTKPVEFLFFGYTHCPDECPLALASLGRAYRSLPPAQRARVRVVFVTVDPARDTPGVVQRYVAGFDPHFVGLTGSSAALRPVWAAYGVEIDARTKEIAHGDAIYAIDTTQHVILVYPPDARAASLAADAGKLAG
jgi:protein SCO1/2